MRYLFRNSEGPLSKESLCSLYTSPKHLLIVRTNKSIYTRSSTDVAAGDSFRFFSEVVTIVTIPRILSGTNLTFRLFSIPTCDHKLFNPSESVHFENYADYSTITHGYLLFRRRYHLESTTYGKIRKIGTFIRRTYVLMYYTILTHIKCVFFLTHKYNNIFIGISCCIAPI